MPKIKKSGREEKKQPMMTPKEKKEAKQLKKHADDAPRFIERSR